MLMNPATDELVIEPGRSEKNYWGDLWRFRELFLILAWRDLSVRYKQTVIGNAWSVIRPVLTMVVFTFVFVRLRHAVLNQAPNGSFAWDAARPFGWHAFVHEASALALMREKIDGGRSLAMFGCWAAGEVIWIAESDRPTARLWTRHVSVKQSGLASEGQFLFSRAPGIRNDGAQSIQLYGRWARAGRPCNSCRDMGFTQRRTRLDG